MADIISSKIDWFDVSVDINTWQWQRQQQQQQQYHHWLYAIISILHVNEIIIIINHKIPCGIDDFEMHMDFLVLDGFLYSLSSNTKFSCRACVCVCKIVRCGECGTLVTHCVHRYERSFLRCLVGVLPFFSLHSVTTLVVVVVRMKYHMCSIMWI